MKLLHLVLCLVVFGFGFGYGDHRQHKNVNVELRSKWSGTSLLLEMGELLANENENNLWKFIDRWLDRKELQPGGNHNTSECLREIVTQGMGLVDGHLASVLQLSLLLRVASPKLVVFKQLAEESLGEHSGKISPPNQSCCWVDVGDKILTDNSQVVDWLKLAANRNLEQLNIDSLELDHVYPRSQSSPYTAVLYGALGTTCFRDFHSLLRDASEKGVARYVYRPVLASGCDSSSSSSSSCARVGVEPTMNLAGYGVQLALKNMEYKAIDDSVVKAAESSRESTTEELSQDVGGFIFSKLLERKPHLEGELMTFRDHLLSSEVSDSMNVWEVKDLGYQAAQRIAGASEPLRLMQELNQNFPNLVSSLSRMKINETIKEEIVSNQQMVPPGRSLFAINGALVNPEVLDAFTLIHMVHEELSFADKLNKLKVPKGSVGRLMRLSEPADQTVVRLDFRSDRSVHYLNDLENDDKYRRWSGNLQELLMPAFPGQLRYLRKNLYHAVYVVDPVSVEGLKVVEMINQYHSRNAPLRFGLILLSPEHVNCIKRNPETSSFETCRTDLSSLVIRLFHYIEEHQGVPQAFQFLNNIEFEDDDESVEESQVEEAFLNTFRELTKPNAMELYMKIKRGNDYQTETFQSSEFVSRLGLADMHPSLLMNGIVYGPSQARSAAIQAMTDELPRIQEAVYFGSINSRTDVLEKFLSDDGYKRYNPKLVASGKTFSLAPLFIDEHPVAAKLQYLHTPGAEDDVKAVSQWLIVDLGQDSGIRLLKEAVRYLTEGAEQGRLGIFTNLKGDLNVSQGERSTALLLSRAVKLAVHQQSRRTKRLRFLQDLLTRYNPNEQNYDKAVQLVLEVAENAGLNTSNFQDELQNNMEEDAAAFQQERDFVYSFFGLAPGTNAIVTNGKLVVQSDDPFIAEDFGLLESLEYKRRAKDVQEIIDEASWEGIEADDLTSDFLSSIIMAASSTMSSRVERSSDTANFELLKADHSAIVRHADESPLHIDAVIDPLSAIGQRLTPLLLMLEEWVQPSMRIVLNPMSSLGDVPLKNFYRYVLPTKDNVLSPHARFTNMPLTKTLTMNLDVPEPWLVEPVLAIHDLDNIILEKLENERTLHAVFELEALMITGRCNERSDPPQGLQLILGTKQHPHIVDTIVMANLGYFQLKAGPGVWNLSLANGRSSELYTLQGPKEGTDEGPISKQVVVQDLRGADIRFQAIKRKGKENEKLLEETQPSRGPSRGLINWASSIIGKRGSSVETHDETINIFSVASGHLYERFLKIMILSVLKNTKRPVKFWFIKNYLSPQFKDVIPHMAREYGFQYELVTYKWPSFLHKQTEKQRLIWAYKILFLDVIFPLSLKKVIYVDADQIVRADMGELYDMDIKGKPLAYTPFCDNNKDMDGYRFWSQGFWKDHLQGKPYHISALYVVDLEKFRQTSAGDSLRVFYENLSKDPNSLSNLDQDLPNYAQHTVPIFSLPQEWLWCESWCGNATKSRAKTIDLCNNPMTKEPKLHGARRIVAEWPALDDEARVFTRKILGDEIASQPLPSSLEVKVSPPATTSGIEVSSTSERKDEL